MENELLELTEFDKVVGEIYKITNTVTNKLYIGQTRSHRLNHKKYRPFGYLGRFKDHIREAYSNKKNVCRYLNSSILKHGSDNFKCELIHTCKVDELDAYETVYISEYNAKFPNGYNLTDGGRGFSHIKLDTNMLEQPPPPPSSPPKRKNLGSKRSDETKLLMSKRNKEAKDDINVRKSMMKSAQQQHLAKSLRYSEMLLWIKTTLKAISSLSIIRSITMNT